MYILRKRDLWFQCLEPRFCPAHLFGGFFLDAPIDPANDAEDCAVRLETADGQVFIWLIDCPIFPEGEQVFPDAEDRLDPELVDQVLALPPLGAENPVDPGVLYDATPEILFAEKPVVYGPQLPYPDYGPSYGPQPWHYFESDSPVEPLPELGPELMPEESDEGDDEEGSKADSELESDAENPEAKKADGDGDEEKNKVEVEDEKKEADGEASEEEESRERKLEPAAA